MSECELAWLRDGEAVRGLRWYWGVVLWWWQSRMGDGLVRVVE